MHVTLILDGDEADPSAAQIRSAAAVLRTLFGRLKISADVNFGPGRGFHNDYSTGKSCPGRLITKEESRDG